MADEPDLFADDDAEEDGKRALGAFADAGIAHQARVESGQAVKMGRPKGSLNRKTQDFEKYYQAMGFHDPLVAMAQFLSSDPVELLSWYMVHEPDPKKRPSLHEINKERHTVASQLAPYLHGKKPTQIEIVDERLPQLIINLATDQNAMANELRDRQAMSAGKPLELEANEINDLDPETGESLTAESPTKEASD